MSRNTPFKDKEKVRLTENVFWRASTSTKHRQCVGRLGSNCIVESLSLNAGARLKQRTIARNCFFKIPLFTLLF